MLGVGPLLRIWGNIGEKMSNFGAVDMTGAGIGGLPGTAAAAQAEIKKIQTERNEKSDHPLNDQRNPGYREAADRWAALHKIAYPEKGGG